MDAELRIDTRICRSMIGGIEVKVKDCKANVNALLEIEIAL